MLTYNTQMARLPLPEYGRNIQQMVDYCLTIEDREERNVCAHSIVKAMSLLFPELKETEAGRRKLWDHLAIMADFKLDIDWPFEIPHPEMMQKNPENVNYPATHIRMRHYGRHLEQMMHKLAEMEPGEERDELTNLVANQMKKCLAVSGLDNVDDARVLKDLATFTHGVINLDPAEYHLHEYEIVAPPSKKKRKR